MCCAEETLLNRRIIRPPKLKHSHILADDNRTIVRRLRKIANSDD